MTSGCGGRPLTCSLTWDGAQSASTTKFLSSCAKLYSLSHMQRLVAEFKVTFTHNPPRRKRICRPKIFLEEEVRALKEVVDDDPSLYPDEIQDRFCEEYGILASRSVICSTIHKSAMKGGLGYNLLVLEVHARQRSWVMRMRFMHHMGLGDIQGLMVLNIDKSREGENDARSRRAWGTVGQRVIKFEGFGRGVNGTLLAVCDANGFVMNVYEFKEGAITTECFCLWLENQVEPILGNYLRSRLCCRARVHQGLGVGLGHVCQALVHAWLPPQQQSRACGAHAR